MERLGNYKPIECELNRETAEVTLRHGDNAITLPASVYGNIAKAIEKEMYYREDVEGEINVRIESGDLPEEAANNEKFIQAVLDAYAELREENNGGNGEYTMNWCECLDAAFEETNYSIFAKEETITADYNNVAVMYDKTEKGDNITISDFPAKDVNTVIAKDKDMETFFTVALCDKNDKPFARSYECQRINLMDVIEEIKAGTFGKDGNFIDVKDFSKTTVKEILESREQEKGDRGR